MEAIIGFVLGIVAVFLIKEYPACAPRAAKRRSTAARRLETEYEAFLQYTGDEEDAQ